MRKILITLAFIMLAAISITAQDTAPAYNLFSGTPTIVEDQVEVEILITNSGADATATATLTLSIFGTGETLASTPISQLRRNSSENIQLSFPLSAIPNVQAGRLYTLEANLTAADIDPESRLIEFAIPADTPITPPPATTIPEQPITNNTLLEGLQAQLDNWLAGLPFEIDLQNPFVVAGGITVLLIVFLLIWLFTVIVRLLFTSRPSYPNNPPPYASMPVQHPESLGGRRQAWQHVTQNGSMLADETEGNLHARKVLLGTNGERFSGWRVVGIRASQYDSYGRIARTQVIGTKSLLRTLTRTIERSESIQREAARRRVKSVAKTLSRQLSRRISRKTATLPIALDVKFKGEHGEVGIQFLLYQYQLGAWRQLDSWNPEMTVTSKAIYEAYTYTIFGRDDDETMRQFRRRLREDMIYVLTEMVLCTPPRLETGIGTKQQPAKPIQNTTPTHEGGRWTVPTTSSMHPIPPQDEETPINPTGDDNDNMDTVARFRPKD